MTGANSRANKWQVPIRRVGSAMADWALFDKDEKSALRFLFSLGGKGLFVAPPN
jgi:hypothetical protein